MADNLPLGRSDYLDRMIIHVDMDCYYASVEMRGNPSLRDRPVVVLSPSDQIQVVGTCNYPAREIGLHSGMSVSEAKRICPDAVFINGDMKKYRATTEELHRLWSEYTDVMQPVMLDEAYLDVTETAGDVDEARRFAHEIKRRVKDELDMGCSVGLGYNMVSAKTGSEEMKPDGYFEILSPQEFMDLMDGRDIGEINSVGPRTSEKLHSIGLNTPKDVREHRAEVISLMGAQAQRILDLAEGLDDRVVTPHAPEDSRTIGRSLTFLKNVDDFWLLSDVIFLICVDIANNLETYGKFGNGVLVLGSYADRTPFSVNRSVRKCGDAVGLYEAAISLFEEVPFRSIRRIGVSVYNLTKSDPSQTTLDSLLGTDRGTAELDGMLESIRKRYAMDSLDRHDVDRDTIRSIAEYMRTHRAR
ncbi:MAG: DNA polymerase IV [Thermoplasmata archaeon]|jgi:DNA polymerase-4/DNA polymerase IV (DinB-like DNA polymerase)|nr:DNA polymerase IV [Thermoplasmata archaeon]